MLRIRKWEQEISRFNQFKNPVKTTNLCRISSKIWNGTRIKSFFSNKLSKYRTETKKYKIKKEHRQEEEEIYKRENGYENVINWSQYNEMNCSPWNWY